MHLTYVVLLTVLQTFPLTWTTKTPLPVALAGSGCAVMHDTVYVIGGRDSGSGRYCTLHIYDPVYDVLDTLAPMSTPRAHVVAAAVNGKMYVFGGWIGSTATNAVEEYDPLTNLWTTKTPMPTARYTSGVAVVNDLIYVIGGMNMSGSVFSTVEEYDPATDTWDTKAPMPTARFGAGCAVINDTIYAFGGSTSIGGGSTTITQRYDPATDTWTWCGSMNEDRYCIGGFAYNGMAYAAGGYDYYNYHATVEVYDPSSNAWSYETAMTYSRQSVAVGIIGDYVYVIGGWNNGAVAYNEEGFLGIGVKDQQTQAISNFVISPNPFRTETRIAFGVGRGATDIEIKIYNIAGVLVKCFPPITHDALRSTLIWDGTDDHGTPLPSGTYLVVVETDDIRSTKKVILLR
jgi:N-acetylneuraminic acid mutarotase